MIEVAEEVEPNRDDDRAAVLVETTDATGETRRYRVTLTGDVLNGKSIFAGKRVDAHDYDRDTPDAPTSAVYEAAREHFRAQGYEVYDGE